MGPISKNRDQRLRPHNQKKCDKQWVLLILRDKSSLAQEMAVPRAVLCLMLIRQLGRKVCSPPNTNGALGSLIQIKRRKRTSTGATSLPPDHFLVFMHHDTMPGPCVAARVPLRSARAGAAPNLISRFRESATSSTLPDMSTAASRFKLSKGINRQMGLDCCPSFLRAVVSCSGQEPQPSHSHTSTTRGSAWPVARTSTIPGQ